MEGLCPVLSEDTSSQESTRGPREISETVATELTLPDEKVTQIENILDLWSGSLKVFILYGILKKMSVCCRISESAGKAAVWLHWEIVVFLLTVVVAYCI